MVIRDRDPQSGVHHSSIQPTRSDGLEAHLPGQDRFPTASPIDRLAANIIDYAIVLLPFVYLVLAPFQRVIKESAIYNSYWQAPTASALAVLAVIVLVIAYQTLTVWVWGATVGKMLLGLRVRPLWSHEPLRFSQAGARAAFWCLSWLGLGVPFLSIFSNLMRRPMHDRVADTIVISIRDERRAAQPTRNEAAVVSGVFWAFGSILAVVLAGVAYSNFEGTSQRDEQIAALEAEDILCPAVSDAQAEWPREQGHNADRLSVAMALYAAGVIDRHCLQAEVNNLHWNGENSALLFLVKSFVNVDTPDLSDRYLDKICESEPDSLECKMSELISHVSDNDWAAAKASFKKMSSYNQIYPTVWAVRQFLKHDEYENAWPYLQKIPDLHALSDFVTPARVKILWALNRREEAAGVEAAAYSNIGVEAKLDVASFVCFEKIWSSCEEVKSHACDTFAKITTDYEDALSSVQTSLAYLRKYECESKNPADVDYARLLSKPLHEDVKALVEALEQKGTDGFAALSDDDSLDDTLSAEVSRRMVERTNNMGLLRELNKEWQGQTQSLAWRKVGVELFHKFYSLHEYELSAEVGRRSATAATPSDRGAMEQLIVSLWRSGQNSDAKNYLDSYMRLFPAPQLQSMVAPSGASRTPAAENEFLEVVRSMRKGSER